MACIILPMRFRLACLFPVLLVSLAVSACHSSGHFAKSADGAAGRGGRRSGRLRRSRDRKHRRDQRGGSRRQRDGGKQHNRWRQFAWWCWRGWRLVRSRRRCCRDDPLEACQAVTKSAGRARSMCLGGLGANLPRLRQPLPGFLLRRGLESAPSPMSPPASARSPRKPATDIRLGLIPSCLVNAGAPRRLACSHSAQCQSGMCISTNQQCPTCKAGGLPVGSACTDSSGLPERKLLPFHNADLHRRERESRTRRKDNLAICPPRLWSAAGRSPLPHRLIQQHGRHLHGAPGRGPALWPTASARPAPSA